MDGVFTLADLKVVLNEDAPASFFRKLASLVASGLLVKVKRGIYAVPDASLSIVSSRIDSQSYVSTGTVLAQKAIISSVPGRRLQAVKTGRSRFYNCELGTIEHLGIDPALFFGFIPVDGVLVATPEKAFLDVCYFYHRGRRFSFGPASDVNTQDLDFKIITDYLERYDTRFVTFFDRIWGS